VFVVVVIIIAFAIGIAIAVSRQRSVRIDSKSGVVIVKGQRFPLAGARAEVDVEHQGVFGRTARTTLTVTAADGRQAVAQIGGNLGDKGKTSRRESARYRQLAAKINTQAAKPGA
jgi:hypothetical protein